MLFLLEQGAVEIGPNFIHFWVPSLRHNVKDLLDNIHLKFNHANIMTKKEDVYKPHDGYVKCI